MNTTTATAPTVTNLSDPAAALRELRSVGYMEPLSDDQIDAHLHTLDHLIDLLPGALAEYDDYMDGGSHEGSILAGAIGIIDEELARTSSVLPGTQIDDEPAAQTAGGTFDQAAALRQLRSVTNAEALSKAQRAALEGALEKLFDLTPSARQPYNAHVENCGASSTKVIFPADAIRIIDERKAAYDPADALATLRAITGTETFTEEDLDSHVAMIFRLLDLTPAVREPYYEILDSHEGDENHVGFLRLIDGHLAQATEALTDTEVNTRLASIEENWG